MSFKVYLVGFGDRDVRLVDVPEEELGNVETTLAAVFRYGQNEFQARCERSVSVGDVIRLPLEDHLVLPAGFLHLDVWTSAAYLEMDVLARRRFVHGTL